MTVSCSACEVRASRCTACGRPGHGGLGRERLDGRAVLDQLAHQVQQLVEPLGVDADGRAGARAAAAGAGLAGRRSASAAAASDASPGTVASRTRTSASSPTARALSSKVDASEPVATHASTRRPAKRSTASGAGTPPTSSPCDAQRLEQHERAHRRHLALLGQLGDDVQHALAGDRLAR